MIVMTEVKVREMWVYQLVSIVLHVFLLGAAVATVLLNATMKMRSASFHFISTLLVAIFVCSLSTPEFLSGLIKVSKQFVMTAEKKVKGLSPATNFK